MNCFACDQELIPGEHVYLSDSGAGANKKLCRHCQFWFWRDRENGDFYACKCEVDRLDCFLKSKILMDS